MREGIAFLLKSGGPRLAGREMKFILMGKSQI
jgi:hypothetical protein